MPRITKTLSITLILLSLLSSFITVSAQEPVVHAVMFYSPSCGHCEYVITQVFPPLMEQYGNQLQIVGIDVTQEGGSAFYQSAIKQFAIPDDRLGVPTLIIDDTVLVGSGEIPEQFPGLIQTALKAGGNDWPNIPGLKETLASQAAAAENGAASTGANADSQSTSDKTEAAGRPELEAAGDIGLNPNPDQPVFISRFLQDPFANTITVIVLLTMIAMVAAVIIFFVGGQEIRALKGPGWIIPVLAIIGVVIAGYMSYVEVTRTQAVCGPIGDCNTVQDSIYAKVFGIPVGILGILGYLAVLAVWLISVYGPQNLRSLAVQTTWLFGWFGILFSIYLTFLEPFVIGATCAWCLSSAIVMSLIFWFSTGPALTVWRTPALDEEIEEEGNEEEEI